MDGELAGGGVVGGVCYGGIGAGGGVTVVLGKQVVLTTATIPVVSYPP